VDLILLVFDSYYCFYHGGHVVAPLLNKLVELFTTGDQPLPLAGFKTGTLRELVSIVIGGIPVKGSTVTDEAGVLLPLPAFTGFQ